MHDSVRLEIGEGITHGSGIADIGLEETVARVIFYAGEGSEVSGVGEFIDVQDIVAAGDE